MRLRYASRTPDTTFRSGTPLSNTLTTYPPDRDNLGKLRLIPDKRRRLERSAAQSQPRTCGTRRRMGQRLIRLLAG